jgi:mannose-6-phosphate isomerase-like protein (cupin superfamily)
VLVAQSRPTHHLILNFIFQALSNLKVNTMKPLRKNSLLSLIGLSALTLSLASYAQTASTISPPSMTADLILSGKDVKFEAFALPGFCGKIEGAFINTDIDKGPFVALLRLAPGAVLAKHYHLKAREVVYVLEGELINDGKLLPKGSSLTHPPGVIHGPHTTTTGVTLMFLQSSPVDQNDSVFIDSAGRPTMTPAACTN